MPGLRDAYLDHVRTIARDQLAWEAIGPVVARCRALIRDAVHEDTRKLATNEAFDAATSPDGGPGSLRDFLEKRRTFLLEYDPAKAGH